MNTKHSSFSFLPDHFLGEKNVSLSLENLHRLGSPKFLSSRESIMSHFSLLGSCNGVLWLQYTFCFKNFTFYRPFYFYTYECFACLNATWLYQNEPYTLPWWGLGINETELNKKLEKEFFKLLFIFNKHSYSKVTQTLSTQTTNF